MEFWLAVLVLAVLVLAVLVLAVLVTALLAELGLVFDDDVHPAIMTVAPATTTSTKMRCFFIFSFSHKQSACRFRLLCYALFV